MLYLKFINFDKGRTFIVKWGLGVVVGLVVVVLGDVLVVVLVVVVVEVDCVGG